MRKNRSKIISIVFIVLCIILINVNVYAHSGRTDSSGGHRDNQNKSGLGSYHYHCGGYPPHLHNNGVCPYSSSSSSNKSSTTSSSISSAEEKSKEPTTILATSVEINEDVKNMEIGECQKLTVTIMPENTTDKNIIWESSDESIATVSIDGEVTAKGYGTVYISVTTTNEKTSTIKINIKETLKEKNSASIQPSTTNNLVDTKSTNNSEYSNSLGGFLTLGLIGGAGYIGYKKHKNKGENLY